MTSPRRQNLFNWFEVVRFPFFPDGRRTRLSQGAWVARMDWGTDIFQEGPA
ncbi:hypothetical protein P0Y35_12520 [Kiritimatiellaeota bacterium B1221]|nr:hypothetical protein [Kiritimatiellaeota bacterium B1221]